MTACCKKYEELSQVNKLVGSYLRYRPCIAHLQQLVVDQREVVQRAVQRQRLLLRHRCSQHLGGHVGLVCQVPARPVKVLRRILCIHSSSDNQHN